MATLSFHALPWKRSSVVQLGRKDDGMYQCTRTAQKGSQTAPEENSCFIWRSCLLGIFITFIKKYQFSISLHNFYSFGFHKNSNKLILLLNGKDIRDSETWGDRKKKGQHRRKGLDESMSEQSFPWKIIENKAFFLNRHKKQYINQEHKSPVLWFFFWYCLIFLYLFLPLLKNSQKLQRHAACVLNQDFSADVWQHKN